MRHIWMGISPGASDTRVMVMDGAGATLLKARLPQAPRHPRAIATLCEAVALWCGRPVRAALAVEGRAGWCASTHWLEALDEVTRTPLYEISFTHSARPPRDERGVEGLGDFRDVRQMMLFEVTR